MAHAHRPAVVAALILMTGSLAAGADKRGQGEAFRLLESMRATAPAIESAVRVHKATLQVGPAILVIDDGVLLPARPVNGETLEVAFSGDAWFRFSTPDPVERQQLELFTGASTLVAPVQRAVLVAGDGKVFANLLAAERAAAAETREATGVFKEWVEGVERRGFAADLAMVKALLGDPLYRGYVAVWCRSSDLGDFFYNVDVSSPEPLALGQFVPLDLSRLDVWQQRGFKSYLQALKYFGRFDNFNAEHPGYWDTWVSSGLPDGKVTVPEPEHYTLDCYISPHVELDAWCSAKVRIRAGSQDVRAIAFALYAGVKVTEVLGSDGGPLDFVRRERAVHVFLPEPLVAGETLEISMKYEGDLVHMLALNESYVLLDTEAWYPRTGQRDRATYDVTLRTPKRFELLASGAVVDSGTENDAAWERRTLELPAIGFTFEIGRFEIVKDQAGHVGLTFGFQGGEDHLDVQERQVVVDTAKKALVFFEEKFGPYPLDYLTITTADRGFSQGMLSMVTLAEAALYAPPEDRPDRVRQRVVEQTAMTIAHELSHQWWGNWVGWSSYRDQWLSEALASYASLLHGLSTAESRAGFLARNALDWRTSLLDEISEGRQVGSLGPVVLGFRLNSSKMQGGMAAIMYDKGAVVFRMMARLIGEETFTRMLGELAKAVGNRTIDTDTFIRAIERMSGSSLRSFADQFVYGTGIPEVYYRYTFEPDSEGEGWIIAGEARLIGSRVERWRVEEDAAQGWRLVRDVRAETEVPTSTLVVPMQVIVTPPQEVQKGRRGTVQSARGFGGKVVIKGHETPFRFKVPEKPERFELDQLGEVLAVFRDEGWAPKYALRLRAADVEASGDPEEGEKLLRQALEAPLYSERALAWIRSSRETPREAREADERNRRIERFENARIRTLLARFLLDRGALDDAEQEIVAAENLLERPDVQAGGAERKVLRSRLDLARGDADAAYRRLRSERAKWFRLGAEGYAVLALAATQTGHDRIAEEAIREAESRGVDMKALRGARASSH